MGQEVAEQWQEQAWSRSGQVPWARGSSTQAHPGTPPAPEGWHINSRAEAAGPFGPTSCRLSTQRDDNIPLAPHHILLIPSSPSAQMTSNDLPGFPTISSSCCPHRFGCWCHLPGHLAEWDSPGFQDSLTLNLLDKDSRVECTGKVARGVQGSRGGCPITGRFAQAWTKKCSLNKL